jgi:hypothetical protein
MSEPAVRNGRKLLVVQVAALSHEFDCGELVFRATESVFPAVTCPVQASFRTATAPAEHGMVSNGRYFRDLRKAMFWEQSAALVEGERIWRGLRARGGTVAMLFWQQSLGEDADIVLSPAPIHRHGGGMIMDCYSRPDGLYRHLCDRLGRPFRLRDYWGPLAKARAGEWIAEATAEVLAGADPAPDLCLTYLPTLDYDLQRYNPVGRRAKLAFAALEGQLRGLHDTARGLGYDVLVFGDYAIRKVAAAVFPNRALAEAGLLKLRPVKDMLYPDLYASRAFAMVDHQVTHVYVPRAEDEPAAREAISQLAGVETIMNRQEQREMGVDHPHGGELVLESAAGTWFAYPWWTHKSEAPDYAGHVDIHNKPGYDPCELRFGWPPPSVSQDTARVRGSHGRVGPENKVAWAATMDLPAEPRTLVDLAAAVKAWLDR